MRTQKAREEYIESAKLRAMELSPAQLEYVFLSEMFELLLDMRELMVNPAFESKLNLIGDRLSLMVDKI